MERLAKLTILSDAVRSGKTTSIWHWLQHRPKAFAILMPDLAQKRKLYISSLHTIIPLEVYAPDYAEENLQHIGRFSFLTASFELAQTELKKAFAKEYDEIIIDEIGKLEYKQQQGFEPMLNHCLKQWQLESKQEIYLVIRDYLLKEACEVYGITNQRTASAKSLLSQTTKKLEKPITNLTALILCGGESSRMGRPKALIDYHGLPQYLWINKMLTPLVSEVVISCKIGQSNWFDPSLKQMHDAEEFLDAGPLGAILSFLKLGTENAILVLGCDYALLQQEHIKQLTEACLNLQCSVALSGCISKPLEPLLSCLHPKDFTAIATSYQNGERSLQRILTSLQVLKIVVEDEASLKSFDEAI
ncbi:MAG: hypothetical protein FGM41_01040 [Bacteroidetes bacterium]|nr:hypothetical protein [Bacteroidota bacterium]